jgi:hypothetical protein
VVQVGFCGGIGGGVLFEDIDPLMYNLLLSFLNPIVSDIDIDFDEEGSSVMDYVIRNMVETSGTNYHLW